MKGPGCLVDICTDAYPVEHNRVFNPYATDIQVNAYHIGKWEEKILAQQIEVDYFTRAMSDSRQNCNVGGDAPQTENITKWQEWQNKD